MSKARKKNNKIQFFGRRAFNFLRFSKQIKQACLWLSLFILHAKIGQKMRVQCKNVKIYNKTV